MPKHPGKPWGIPWRNARIVAYDITNDRTRQRAANFLLKHGRRLQKSVFLIAVTPHALPSFLRELDTFRDPGDIIDVIPLCPSCRTRGIRLGLPIAAPAIVVVDG